MRRVNPERLGRLTRLLRIRQRLTQVALAERAAVTRQAVSWLECGRAGELRLGAILAIVAALGARLDLRLLWNGPELDRLLDAGHAALATAVKRRLERWHWLVRVEVSFNHYGDRGRIDLLAFHPATGILLVIEIKTELVDVQDLLGSLDVKARVARRLATERFGWDVRSVVSAIVFAEDRTTRNRLERIDGLFDRYPCRGRAALSWLRRPTEPIPTGLLWLTAIAEGRSRAASAARVRRPSSRSVTDSKSAAPARH